MYTIQVENIKCGGCAHRIEDKLSRLSEVEKVEVQVESGTVTILGSFDLAFQEKVEGLLKAMGYPKVGEGGMVDNAKSYVSCMIGRVTK